jgi:trehalose 6-phosphate synthase/phosphatase
MPLEEQKTKIHILQERLSRYNVEKWAEEFIKSLDATKTIVHATISTRIDEKVQHTIVSNFKKANKKLVLLDYDGTLVGFHNSPRDSFPDAELLETLDKLNKNDDTHLVIISGRDRETLGNWLGHKDYTLITDHGVWLKNKGKDWEALENLKNDWKINVLPIMESFVNRTPGAFIEEKEYSLAWHYRKADPELAKIRNMELKLVLTSLISNNGLAVLEGNKVLEIKSSSVNKGRASAKLLIGNDYDFIFAIGDDRTDEYMFEELPEESYTVKVGTDKSHAKYYVKNTTEVRALLNAFNKA